MSGILDADDDGDVVAIDDGMQPADATDDAGDDESEDAGDDDADLPASAGGERVIPAARGTRPISGKTRELMRAAVAKLKAQRSVDPDDDYDVMDTPAEPEAADRGGDRGSSSSPSPAAASGAPAPAPGLPTPALDPEVGKLRQQYAARLAELDAREAELAARASSSDAAKLRETYLERGAPAVVEMVKLWSGLADGDDLKAELADLVTDLSHHVLGVAVPPEVVDRLGARRAVKSVKALKEDARREREALDKQRLDAEQQATFARVKTALALEIAKPEHAKVYPWLAAEDTAGDIVFDIVQRKLERDGVQLSWQDAAKIANDTLHQQASAYYDKRKHLLAAAPANAGSATGGSQARPGRPPGPQVTRATPTPQPQPSQPRPVEDGKWNAEAHRRQTKQRFRAAFAKGVVDD